MRKINVEHMVTTGMFQGKPYQGRQRIKPINLGPVSLSRVTRRRRIDLIRSRWGISVFVVSVDKLFNLAAVFAVLTTNDKQ